VEGKPLLTEPLHPAQAIEAAGFFGRMMDSLRMTFE
jgi:hypothetical protein